MFCLIDISILSVNCSHVCIIYLKICDKISSGGLEVSFSIVNFPFLDGNSSRSHNYSVYISQLVRIARLCSHVDYFNNRKKILTSKIP